MSDKNEQQSPAASAHSETVPYGAEADAESSIDPSIKDTPPKEPKLKSIKKLLKSPATKRYEEARRKTREDLGEGNYSEANAFQPISSTPGAAAQAQHATARTVWMR